jgi:AAA+ superfamily predicted ATPase
VLWIYVFSKLCAVHFILQELDVPLMNVAGPELIAGVSGESEERIRDLFDQAAEIAPCILFLDEVDALAPNRHTAQREMERRVVAQLLSCLDGRFHLLFIIIIIIIIIIIVVVVVVIIIYLTAIGF